MEERGQSNSTGQHKLILQNRKSGSFTGVTDVVNFDANEIILDTELGRLTITMSLEYVHGNLRQINRYRS